MIRSGNAVRFTPQEIDNYRKVGVDVTGIKTRVDLENAIGLWAHTLSEEKSALLEKIALEMARKQGKKLPAKLVVIPSSEGSPQRS